MKIDAYRHEVTGFEFEATDEQGRVWECRASFAYENQGTLDDPKYVTTDLNEFEGRCVTGEYHSIVPSPKLLTALRDAIETNDEIHEAETEAIACGRDR